MFGILSPIFLKDDLPRHLRWVRVTWHTHDKELRRFGRRRRQEAAEEARGYVLAAADGDACEKTKTQGEVKCQTSTEAAMKR